MRWRTPVQMVQQQSPNCNASWYTPSCLFPVKPSAASPILSSVTREWDWMGRNWTKQPLEFKFLVPFKGYTNTHLGGFSYMGVPPVIIHFTRIFHYKPSSELGNSPWMEPPKTWLAAGPNMSQPPSDHRLGFRGHCNHPSVILASSECQLSVIPMCHLSS